MTARTCAKCDALLGRRNTSGLCRPHLVERNNADPQIIARRRAGILRRFADPVYREAHAERCRAFNRNLPDEVRESRRRHGKLIKAERLRAANAAMSDAVRAENGRKRSDTVLAWCLPEWRAHYRDLKSRGRRAPEAKAIVLGLIAGGPAPQRYARQRSKMDWCPPERRREYEKLRSILGAPAARAALEAEFTRFERQLARVAAGAKLITVTPLRRPDPDRTLGGVASAEF